jgi:hypothetical protein
MFDVEPRHVTKVPVTINMDFETPTIQTEIDPAQFNIMMQLVNMGVTTIEKAMEKLGLREMLTNDSSTGGDVTPSIKTWPVSDSFDKHQQEMHQSKIELLDIAKKAIKIQNGIKEKEQSSKQRTAV